jgi:hypothetical protein
MNRKGLGVIALLGAVGAGAYWLLTFHRHKFTWPFTAHRKDKSKIHYVVCLTCAKEFLYDTDTLVVGEQVDIKHEVQ